MKKLQVIFTLLLCALSVRFAYSQTTKDAAKNFIANARLLEKKPFDPNAKAAREKSFLYITETSDVSVVLCSDTMKLIPEKKNKFKSELLMQFTFGMAMFKLENPARASDEIAAQVAGLESMLRTYQVMLAENPKARNAELDALVAKRDKSELKALVEAAKCSK